jgi:hypothetical protein
MTIVLRRTVGLLLGALALGGCVTRSGRSEAARGVAAAARPTLSANNEGSDWLDFYLIGDAREWYLGRVAAGAKARLPLPADFPRERQGTLQLAVIAGAPRGLQVGRDPRAVVTVQQSLPTLLGQHWTFARRQLTGLRPHPQSQQPAQPPSAAR